MKTTLKRGMGRGGAVNGNGRPIYPPSPPTPMTRYRQPDPPKRGAWHLVTAIFLWTLLAALIIGAAAGGAAYLKGHQFVQAISPKTRSEIAAAKRLDLADPSQPTIALVIGTDRRKGFLDPRRDLGEIAEMPVQARHQLHGVGIQHCAARAEIARGGPPNMWSVLAR